MVPNRFYSLLVLLIGSILVLSGCASSTSSFTSQERPPLHQAALMGDINKIKQLLASGANPNEPDHSEFTPIHWAAASSLGHNREMIEVLVEHGANPNLTINSAKMVPLQFVHNAEAAKALIDAGARLDTRDIASGTPLHNATKPDIAKVLLDHGADRNAKNGLGQTPVDKLRQALPYFNKGGIYDTIRQQYQDTIEVLTNYYPNQANTPVNTSTTASTSGDVWLDETPSQNPAPEAFLTPAAMAAVEPLSPEPDFDKAEKRAKELEAKQACPMYDYDWFYLGKDCQNELAQGTGSAENPYQELKFEGKIVDGLKVEGTLYKGKKQIYEGGFKDDQPHGSGVCFYQGSPEECRYYKGERIDTLHKQREEFKKQQEILSEQTSQQKAQPTTTYKQDAYTQSNYTNNNYSQPDYSTQAPRYNTSYSEPASTSDPVSDAIQDELIEQGTKMLLDQFF
ncbi:ankyrin repeat domain-containing protein [Litoribrevibacter albus]|uniref:Ankyrin repeat domain-containing protein n=1 Tax=Litoribrevibacter albus TaxID=1473156 RepID=A0AA37SE54_9GAMM|nr:ankyrin repeat domain-containing protein [Litoribrevibacter albus]GLQ32567.1 hypothetical protein GCM10007876_30460 [Litoribrevibacter albus]